MSTADELEELVEKALESSGVLPHYVLLARQLQTTPDAVKNAISRLRARRPDLEIVIQNYYSSYQVKRVR